jgi:phosphomannomutase
MWASSATPHRPPVRPFKKSDLVAGLMATRRRHWLAESRADQRRDGVKYILADDSWLLIRPSGTEPVLRIYAEARTDAQVKALLREGAAMAEAQQDNLLIS